MLTLKQVLVIGAIIGLLAVIIIAIVSPSTFGIGGGEAAAGTGKDGAGVASGAPAAEVSPTPATTAATPTATAATPTPAAEIPTPPLEGPLLNIAKPCVRNWKFYNSMKIMKGPYDEYTKEGDGKDWCMLPAYFSGGERGVNWKYTTDENDPDCLTDWTYYSYDGKKVIVDKIPRTTMEGDTKRWCATRVYKSGGIMGKAWRYRS